MVLVLVPLYWMVEAVPNVGEADSVAVPSIDMIPLIVGTLVSVLAPDPAKVRLLKVVLPVPAMVCAFPPNLTVPVEGVNVQAVALDQAVPPVKFTFKVLEPPSKVPAVRVTKPVNVWVSKVPRFSVPPVALNVNAAAPTFPVNVVLPAVLVYEIKPVVVKPSTVLAAAFVPAK